MSAGRLTEPYSYQDIEGSRRYLQDLTRQLQNILDNLSSDVAEINEGVEGPQGPQGPKGDDADLATTWIGLTTGWNTTPTFNATIATGDVWTYVYNGSGGNVTYYRLVPSGSADDAFYTTFTAGVLSGLVATKEIEIT